MVPLASAEPQVCVRFSRLNFCQKCATRLIFCFTIVGCKGHHFDYPDLFTNFAGIARRYEIFCLTLRGLLCPP